MSDLALYTSIYGLFCICITFPPIEFITAGFTITSLFSSFLGDEKFEFIAYHLRRTVLVMFIHSCLPFLYFIFLECMLDERVIVAYPSNLLQCFAYASLIFSLGFGSYLILRYARGWDSHPTIECLKKYDSNWKLVAKNINDEYRDRETFAISLSGVNKIVMTNSWILSVTNYSLKCAQVSDVQLEAVQADEHPISHHEQSGGSVQFVNIEVRSITNKLEPFIIRIRTESFRDIRDKISKPIGIAREVVLRQSLNDRFVDAFVEQVNSNPPYLYSDIENLEDCFGCASVKASVKLIKSCVDAEVDEYGEHQPPCTRCFCRPMWCKTCIARIFAAKQDKSHPERWLQGKANCPTCRSVFCVLDVSSIHSAF